MRLSDMIRQGLSAPVEMTERKVKEVTSVRREIFYYLAQGGRLTVEKAYQLWGTHKLVTRISELRKAMEKHNDEYVIADRIIDEHRSKEYWLEKR